MEVVHIGGFQLDLTQYPINCKEYMIQSDSATPIHQASTLTEGLFYNVFEFEILLRK